MRIPKHISLFVLLAGFSVAAVGQMRNPPPASIYSIGGTQLGPPPASIYSAPTQTFGFRHGGFNGIPGNGRFVVPSVRQHHHHRNQQFVASPIYVPYAVYPYDAVDVESPDDVLQGAGTFNRPQSQVTEEEAPAPTVFERRPAQDHRAPQYRPDDSRYGEHYLDQREARPQPAEAATPAPEPRMEDIASTVLVFRDGHRSEVKNYAMMGNTVYVFAGERRKIPLSELNLEATVRENDDRGVEFQVPSTR